MKQHSGKEIWFMGSAEKDFQALPAPTQEDFSLAIGAMSHGKMPANAKPWKGIGPGVYELVENFRGDTFRAVLTVRFSKALYVLHVFKKKSLRGIKTPLPDVRLISSRLQAARLHYAKVYEKN